ncbi:MAG: DUF5050 domain-containing protein, partial [candidate division Zixibacteria bacterium]|nr:DUF5050 domain-containing protein [candidate division Zixibacteria bacterium]
MRINHRHFNGIKKTSITIYLFILLLAVTIVQLNCSKKVTNSEPTLTDYKLAFVMEVNYDSDIYSINPDGTELTQLTNTDEDEFNPIWSPDGLYIYYQTYNNSTMEIFRMNIDGTNKTNITNHSAWDYLKDISSDGTKMVFLSTRSSQNNIYIMDLTDSTVTQMTNDTHGEYGPVYFTPNGHQIIYS